MEAVENLLTRRSVRAFLDRQVEREALLKVIECGRYAPSGRNTQNWQFTAVRNADWLEALNRAVNEAFAAEGVDRGGSLCTYGAPTLILVSAPKDSPHGRADCACAMENMMLAAHALGLASCWINQPAQFTDNAQVRALLTEGGVPQSHTVHASLALGYAKGGLPGPKPRREGSVRVTE